jgi:hypothetical protein
MNHDKITLEEKVFIVTFLLLMGVITLLGLYCLFNIFI